MLVYGCESTDFAILINEWGIKEEEVRNREATTIKKIKKKINLKKINRRKKQKKTYEKD